MSAKLSWEDVDSSNVDKVAYHEESQTLAVRFRNGTLYTYQEVSSDNYHGLVGAESVGQYLNRFIKPMYTYIKWQSEDELTNAL